MISADVAVAARGLGKRYRRLWALRDCTFELPAGRIAALVGANGAGKTTLLGIIAGLLRPSTGRAGFPGGGRLGFVAQEKPLYGDFTVTDMLGFAMHTNVVWDQWRAVRWLSRFEIPLNRRCRTLSDGQEAQVAFAIALGARPDLLLLDEPLADLDPLARREVMGELLAEVAETETTVVLSTHVLSELGGVADHLLLLGSGRLLLDGDVDDLLASHALWLGPHAERPAVQGEVIIAEHSAERSSFLVRESGTSLAIPDSRWVSRPVALDDLVLAYLKRTRHQPTVGAAA